MNGKGGGLELLAHGADILIAHNAVPEDSGDRVARALHMPPSVIGRIAQQAGVKRVALSHRMLRTRGREPRRHWKRSARATRDRWISRMI
jgi:ribonuclease BN (tRNA processing enzyme)